MLYVMAGMWESRCSFKTQPVNVRRPSAADGRLLNNFDNAVLSAESAWVYVMPQTRLGEGAEEQGQQPEGARWCEAGQMWAEADTSSSQTPKASCPPRKDLHLEHS